LSFCRRASQLHRRSNSFVTARPLLQFVFCPDNWWSL
jgi:hypothetical protein